MITRLLCWTVVVALLAPPCLLAQWQLWTRVEGADVSRFYASPSGVLYVQLSSGMKIFRSFDGGISWTELVLPRSNSTGFFAPCTDSLGLEALVFISDRTFYRSRDHGLSWHEIPSPEGLIPSEEIHTVVAGRYGELLIATRSAGGIHLYMSRDQATSVFPIGEIPAGTWGFYQAHDSVFYCYGNGLYRIDWRTRTIVQRSTGQYHRFISTQEFSGAPVILWAIRGNTLLRSTDGGVQWNDASMGLPPLDASTLLVSSREGTIFCLVRSASGDTTVIYRRFAGTASWTLASRQTFIANDIVATLSGTLLVATPKGVFSSEESGLFWSNSSSGIQGIGVSCVAYDPAVALIATTTSGEIFRSVNAGLSWTSSATLPSGTVVVDAYIRAPNTVLIATNSGLWCSTDGGVRFAQCSTASGPISEPILSLAWFGGMFIAAGAQIGYISTDARLWTAVSLPLPPQETVVSIRTNDSIAIVVTTHSIIAVERVLPPTLRTIATLGATILDGDVAHDGSIGVIVDSAGLLHYRRYRGTGTIETAIALPVTSPLRVALSYGGRAVIAVKNEGAVLYTIGRTDQQATADTTIPEPVLYLRRQSTGELLATTAYGAIYRLAKDSILSTAPYPHPTFIVTPNPTSEVLRIISTAEGIEHLSIYNPQGKIVFEQHYPLRPTDVLVKLPPLPSGYYIAYVLTRGSTMTNPIIIMR